MSSINGDTSRRESGGDSFSRLYRIVSTLRGPGGCPWDQEQTLLSMRDALVEEAYECIDAISTQDVPNLREELGDIYLLATMLGVISENDGLFTVDDALDEVTEKLIRRHPHVFGESDANTSAQVLAQWNSIKRREKEQAAADGAIGGDQVHFSGTRSPAARDILNDVSMSLPPLRRSIEYQKKAAKIGFDWPTIEGVMSKLVEEVAEIKGELVSTEAPDSESRARIEEEIGDLLFTVVNLARTAKIDPDVALSAANVKFRARLAYVTEQMARQNRIMSKDEIAEMERLWNESKEVVR